MMARQDILETPRLVLRRPGAADIAAYTAYCLSERTRWVGGPFTELQAFDKLAAMIGHWELRGFGRFVFTERGSGRPIGHAGAMQLIPDAPPELTWTIWAGADEGRGYATEACEACRAHAARDLGFRRMIARIEPENHASRRLAERLGGLLEEDAVAPDWFPGTVTYGFALS